MKTFFDADGVLNIDDIIINQPSFKKMMEDGVITEKELNEQSQRVVSSLKNLEGSLDEPQINKVRELLAEISVMVAARSIYEQQR